MPDGPRGQVAEDATGAGETPAPGTTTPPSTSSAQTQPAPQPPTDSDAENGEEFDKDKALQTIRAQRANERKLAKELETARAELKKRQDAEKTETERLAERVKELEATLHERDRALTQTALEGALRDAGAKHPDLLVARVDAATLERDERGRFSNLDKHVDTLRRTYPDLFFSRTGSADGGGGTQQGATGTTDMNRFIARATGHG